MDAGAPHKSLVWKYFGGSAGTDRRGRPLCIPDGPFRSWRSEGLDPSLRNGDCIRRAFDPETGENPDGDVYAAPCVRRIVETAPTERQFRLRWTLMHDAMHW